LSGHFGLFSWRQFKLSWPLTTSKPAWGQVTLVSLVSLDGAVPVVQTVWQSQVSSNSHIHSRTITVIAIHGLSLWMSPDLSTQNKLETMPSKILWIPPLLYQIISGPSTRIEANNHDLPRERRILTKWKI
jgi:hypothetical protein